MENGNNINYTHHVFKLIKQFDINLYQHLLEYFKTHGETKLSSFLSDYYKNQHEDHILEIVKGTCAWYTKEELNDISNLSSSKWHIFLYETDICFCDGYDYNRLLKLNKIFWEDNILLQYIKEHNLNNIHG